MEKKLDLLSLGEVLMRLSPEGEGRLVQEGKLVKQIGGAELNVAAGAAMLGLRAGMLSVLPSHAVGVYAKSQIQAMGVSAEYMAYDESSDARLGLYYYEKAASPRKPAVVYDRKHSSIHSIHMEDFPEEMYGNVRCFHTSGITLGLGGNVRETAVRMIRKFKEAGALISFDVNFRGNLWTGEEARACIEEILPYVDIFFCSESTANLTFKREGDVREILKGFAEDYPLSVVAATRRTVHSPKQHSFDSIVYDQKADAFYEETPYKEIEVVDRIGSGDAYISGFLYGLLSENGSCKKAMQYGNAVSALKNTVPGDMVYTDTAEIDAMIAVHEGKKADLEMAR